MTRFRITSHLTSLLALVFAVAMPFAAQAQSCPCSCAIQTGAGPETVSIDGGVPGVGTPTGPANIAETRTACQELCQAQATSRTGTLTTATVGECPASLFGAAPGGTGTGAGETGGTAGGGTAGSIPLFNPLGDDIGVAEFISRGLRAVIGFIGALALLMFVYGGVMWMTAGDSKRIDTAKEILKNSTIGLVLIFFSYSIVSIVFSLLGSS